MTHGEWDKHKVFLERSIASLKGHTRSGRNDLKAKIKYQSKMRQQMEVLRLHKLNYHLIISASK